MLIAHSTSSCALAYEGNRITRNKAVVFRIKSGERGWYPLDDEDASLNASELVPASLHRSWWPSRHGGGSLPSMRKQ
jgi:hypothetical protein